MAHCRRQALPRRHSVSACEKFFLPLPLAPTDVILLHYLLFGELTRFLRVWQATHGAVMRRTKLAYFLLFLLALAALDDACAAATPDTSDDVAAAENDEYLPSTCRPFKKAVDESELQLSPFLSAADDGPCTAPARGRPANAQPGPLVGPSPLYVFMSMKC